MQKNVLFFLLKIKHNEYDSRLQDVKKMQKSPTGSHVNQLCYQQKYCNQITDLAILLNSSRMFAGEKNMINFCFLNDIQFSMDKGGSISLLHLSESDHKSESTMMTHTMRLMDRFCILLHPLKQKVIRVRY